MTTEISKLMHETAAFVKMIESKRNNVEEILKKLQKSVPILREQLDVVSVSRRAAVPLRMLQKFPDVKQRLLSKLNILIEEEIVEITKLVDELSQFSEELRKISNRMEKFMTQIKWSEHVRYFNPFSEIFEWSDKCWKYFRLICVNLRNGLSAVAVDDTHSSVHLKSVLTVDGTSKEYVFNNHFVNMFQSLKIDFSSRPKVLVS